MYRRIGRLIQIGVFAALPAGAAFAQGSGANVPNTGGITDKQGGQGSDSANGLAGTTATDDTRTPAQEKARKLDQTTPSVPGDSARPGEIAPKSDRTDTTIHDTTIHQTDTSGTSGTSGSGSMDNTGRMGDTTGSTTPGSGATDNDMRKSDNNLGSSMDSTTSEKKSVKHRRGHKSSSSSSSSIESKSSTTLPDDTSMNKKLDDKSNLDKDQLNSDK